MDENTQKAFEWYKANRIKVKLGILLSLSLLLALIVGLLRHGYFNKRYITESPYIGRSEVVNH